MATQGGFGLVCKIAVGTTLTAIAHILEADFPAQIKELYDSTAHDSTDGYRTFVDSGLKELGEFTMRLMWDSADSTHAAIVTAFTGTAAVNMSIEDPDGVEVIAFSALTYVGGVLELLFWGFLIGFE